MSLANKYRPKDFSDVTAQTGVIRILERQIETKTFVNTYLLVGPSGVGKTTLARILAKKINQGFGEPIQIDAASNNGVDNVRSIIEEADQRALDCEYKVYIIDEVHALTNQSWQALLKLLEEPPKYTIFILCTTEVQKVPETIQNRCQQFRLSRIPDKDITSRLRYICDNEGIECSEEALVQITKMASGSMRQAISYLDKCKDYSDKIGLNDVYVALGSFSYDIYFNLMNAIIDKNNEVIINTIDKIYNDGYDLKVFIDLFLEFALDVTKYIIFNSFDVIKIPTSYKEQLLYIINVETPGKYYNHVIDKLLELKQLIKGDNNLKITIEIFLISRI